MSRTDPTHLPRRAAGDCTAVVIAGTLDTKGEEIAFARTEAERRGLSVLVVDCGILGHPAAPADIPRAEVAAAAGADIAVLRGQASREVAIPAMIRGLEVIVRRLHAQGRLAGYLGIGGGTNAALAAAAFRVLPFGVPKLLVSTVASGNTRPFVGYKDVLLFHPVVDILGLNGVLRRVLRQAVAALAAMVGEGADEDGPAPVRVGLTAFGATTAAASRITRSLSPHAAEVLTFHARGTGGQAMEALVRDGTIRAVLDLTTTEVADEVVGGALSAGPDRLTAAAGLGIPQVVLPGAVDMVNFGPRPTVPERFGGRLLVSHTPAATLMRTTPAENERIAAFMAERLNGATGPAAVVLPLRGFSAYDAPGGPFFDPVADEAFRSTLLRLLRPHVAVHQVDAHLNDPATADLATSLLLAMMDASAQGAPTA